MVPIIFPNDSPAWECTSKNENFNDHGDYEGRQRVTQSPYRNLVHFTIFHHFESLIKYRSTYCGESLQCVHKLNQLLLHNLLGGLKVTWLSAPYPLDVQRALEI